MRLDAGQPGALEAERVGAVRDDDGDARVEPAVADGVDDGLEVGPPARDQDADVAVHVTLGLTAVGRRPTATASRYTHAAARPSTMRADAVRRASRRPPAASASRASASSARAARRSGRSPC
ncbi:MAG: hypothetical protein MZV64_04655 [Ignavibacteriales bacterium]|nr:hypothetical protein [Ignavibacteriales bacterium]